MSRYESLWRYVKEQSGSFSLSFAEVEKITGFPIDHAFLTCKKELEGSGWKAGKISLKKQSLEFVKE